MKNKFYQTLLFLILFSNLLFSQRIEIDGPAGSGSFGATNYVLPNGNYIITDPDYSEGGQTNIGAVYLYNGATHQLISTTKGSHTDDQIGYWDIAVLPNSNFVINSPWWDNGTIIDAGAVTLVNGTTGLNGTLNASNSLVGGQIYDYVGIGHIKVLPNGHFVVLSNYWNDGPKLHVGAVTWCKSNVATTGFITETNSLIGSTEDDYIGSEFFILKNGNYVIQSILFDNSIPDVGAVTWGNGMVGTVGKVSAANSLIGASTNDFKREGQNDYKARILPLTNGNYVVRTDGFDNGAIIDAGSFTLCSGIAPTSAIISVANSLVGGVSTGLDDIDTNFSERMIELPNGNYLALQPQWENAGVRSSGSVTYCQNNLASPTVGLISSSNSLVGSSFRDKIGEKIVILSNGNYVVGSPSWHLGAAENVGAATWCNGTTGRVGTVSSGNSLLGSNANEYVGYYIKNLSNGNYVVISQNWNNGIANVGAATFCNGTTGRVGAFSAANSLTGSVAGDMERADVFPLTNGNYVVASPYWANGSAIRAGAVTLCSGTLGFVGTINTSNSLVGTSTDDFVGGYIWGATGSGAPVGQAQIYPLSNGNYVVPSPDWNRGAISKAGASTWCSGITGKTGAVSAVNSLVGSNTNDRIGEYTDPLTNGNYVVTSHTWDNGLSATDAGASTWRNGTVDLVGPITATNSLIGSTTNDYVGSFKKINNNFYVVFSNGWNNGSIAQVGAVTICDVNTGKFGVVGPTNSLVGVSANDRIGNSLYNYSENLYPNIDFALISTVFDNGTLVDAGAITPISVSDIPVGPVNGCNSILGYVANQGNSRFPDYNPTHNYFISSFFNQNRVGIHYKNGITLPTQYTQIINNDIDPAGQDFIDENCRIVASIKPTGTFPLYGTTIAKEWIEPTTTSAFAKRHFQIKPNKDADIVSGVVTLYLSQNDFDIYNSFNPSKKLPTKPTDTDGIANIQIEKRSGESSDNTGLPATYPGAPTIIDPDDADIVWDADNFRWKISFETTGFSGFFVKTPPAVALPVRLISFKGKKVGENNVLNWKTTEEKNVSHFEIERSLNAKEFEKIGKVFANNSENYQFNDNSPFIAQYAPLIFYRLKMVDHDEHFDYSKIISITNDAENESVGNFYPNPAINDYSNIDITTQEKEKWTITQYNISGKLIKTEIRVLEKGLNIITISNIEKGLNIVQFENEKNKEIRKLFR